MKLHQRPTEELCWQIGSRAQRSRRLHCWLIWLLTASTTNNDGYGRVNVPPSMVIEQIMAFVRHLFEGLAVVYFGIRPRLQGREDRWRSVPLGLIRRYLPNCGELGGGGFRGKAKRAKPAGSCLSTLPLSGGRRASASLGRERSP
jgi:hypothetical protein